MNESVGAACAQAGRDPTNVSFETACFGMSGGPDDKREILAAIVRAGVERGEPFRVISQAWRADLNRRAFSESSLDGLRCFNKPFDGR